MFTKIRAKMTGCLLLVLLPWYRAFVSDEVRGDSLLRFVGCEGFECGVFVHILKSESRLHGKKEKRADMGSPRVVRGPVY